MGEKSFKHSILFVDDEENNLTVFRTAFRRFYNIFTAISAKDGLEIMRKNEIHLLITDQRMPEMTGIEFLEKVIPEFPLVIRMVLTGFSDVEAIIQAINKGRVYKYITKPWNTDELKLTMDKALEAYDLKIENLKLVEDLKQANLNLERKVEERTREVVSQRDELKYLNATKDKFFSILAHDLKNPFSAIMSITGTLADNYQELDDEDKIYSVQRVKKSVDQVYELLENLLIWARSQTGRIGFEKQSFDLSAVVGSVSEILALHAEKKRITINSEVMKNTMVSGDKNMVTTILRNLMNNAIKFTPENGQVRIFTRSNNKIHSNGFLDVIIQDTGIGLSQEDINKLFKIEVSHKTIGNSKEKGTGLGLIICKEFVGHHGGEISVESQPGQGSSFIFSIPAV